MTRHSVPVFRIALASLVLASGFGIALYITTRAWRPTLGLIGFLTVMFHSYRFHLHLVGRAEGEVALASYHEILQAFVVLLRLVFLACALSVMFNILRPRQEDRIVRAPGQPNGYVSDSASRRRRLRRLSVVLFPLIIVVSRLIEKVPWLEVSAALLLGFSGVLYLLWRRERLRLD